LRDPLFQSPFGLDVDGRSRVDYQFVLWFHAVNLAENPLTFAHEESNRNRPPRPQQAQAGQAH
jgi:hypothetical protein